MTQSQMAMKITSVTARATKKTATTTTMAMVTGPLAAMTEVLTMVRWQTVRMKAGTDSTTTLTRLLTEPLIVGMKRTRILEQQEDEEEVLDEVAEVMDAGAEPAVVGAELADEDAEVIMVAGTKLVTDVGAELVVVKDVELDMEEDGDKVVEELEVSEVPLVQVTTEKA